MDNQLDESRRQKLKSSKKRKRNEWRARKKANLREANREERRQKLLNDLRDEIKEGNGNREKVQPSKRLKIHSEKLDASTLVSSSVLPKTNSDGKVNASLSRGRCMVQKALNLDKPDDISKLQKNVSRSVTTNSVNMSSSAKKNGETAKKTSRQFNVKELDESLLARIKGIKALGTGTFGTCYLAKYRNRTVAVKEYLDSSGIKPLHDLQSAARREAKVIQEINDHRGVPFLFGLCTMKKPVRILLFYHGEGDSNLTIYQACRRKPELCNTMWNKILWLTSDALEHIHACGIIQNDLRANNIVLEKKNTIGNEVEYNPVVIDFGKSVKVHQAVTSKPKPKYLQLTNVDSYIAPEIVHGKAPPSFKSDMYSLG